MSQCFTKTANGKLYTIRTATAAAVSHRCADATFSATVTEPDAIEAVGTESVTKQATYDLQGRRIKGTPQKGIYIIDGKKVLLTK